MNQLDRYLDSALNLGGTFDNKLRTLEARMADLDEESQSFDERMDALEERLRFQFAAADALISQLNSTSTYLDQQLKALPGYNNDK
jgi:flagellar hook-associated protein 2